MKKLIKELQNAWGEYELSKHTRDVLFLHFNDVLDGIKRVNMKKDIEKYL